MQNNIRIRNLYIGKIQKQISKLTYSINLLNNLNNVIDNQYGGADSVKLTDELKLIQENVAKGAAGAKATLNAITNPQQSATLSASINSVDNSKQMLEATIRDLKKNIKKLMDQNKDAKSPEEITALNKKIEDLEAQLKEANTIMDTFKTSITAQLKEYDDSLKLLKEKFPFNKHSLIQQFRSQIQKYISMIDVTDNTPEKFNYNSELSDLIKRRIQSKIAEKFSKLQPTDAKNLLIPYNLDIKNINGVDTIKINNEDVDIKPFNLDDSDEAKKKVAMIDQFIKNNDNKVAEIIKSDNIKNILTYKNKYKELPLAIDNYIFNNSISDEQSIKDVLDYFNITEADLKETN